MGTSHPLTFLDQHFPGEPPAGTTREPQVCPGGGFRRPIGAEPPGPGGSEGPQDVTGPPVADERPLSAPSAPPAAPGRGNAPDDVPESTWAELEDIGRWTGHVLTLCPSCGGRAMVSVLNASGTSRWVKSGGGWPRCRQCRGGVTVWRNGRPSGAGPPVEPVGDVGRVLRVKPGHNPTARQVKALRALAAAGIGPEAPTRPQEPPEADAVGDDPPEGQQAAPARPGASG